MDLHRPCEPLRVLEPLPSQGLVCGGIRARSIISEDSNSGHMGVGGLQRGGSYGGATASPTHIE